MAPFFNPLSTAFKSASDALYWPSKIPLFGPFFAVIAAFFTALSGIFSSLAGGSAGIAGIPGLGTPPGTPPPPPPPAPSGGGNWGIIWKILVGGLSAAWAWIKS